MATPQVPAAAVTSRKEMQLSRSDQLSAFVGTVVAAGTVLTCVCIPSSFAYFRRISSDGFYKQEFLRLDTILVGVFLSAYLLTPAIDALVRRLRPLWRDAYTYGGLATVCAFLWFFVVLFGRWQFGGFDFNILIELGWRQIMGQQPYVDFPVTTPPGFNLGIKYAFELFGVNWDANLYLSAIFACATFLWMHWLMTLMSTKRLASAAVAFAIECAAMLTLCFWWYNNSVLILAAVFFLSCLAYVRQPKLISVQVSYVVSLTLLSLMKPNIAGLTIACGVVMLLLVTDRKLRTLLLTLGAAAAALGLLAVNNVPVRAMLASYLSVAKQHGGLHSKYEFRALSSFERHSALAWIGVLSIPLLGLVPKAVKQIGDRDWRGVGLTLLLSFSLLIALYGLLTNGEFRDAECTVLLAACGVITFGLRWNGPFLRRLYVAIVCASIVGDLYYGAVRTRVYGVGPHVFFEWQDNQHRIDSGFLRNMRVSAQMVEVESEVKQALEANPGPYFFGTRVDFNYAVFELRSPEGFPAWWHPGTAFALSDEPQIIRRWRQNRFQTLIFMKEGFGEYSAGMFYTYYPQEFLDAINSDYVRDDHYPDITVYHRLKAEP